MTSTPDAAGRLPPERHPACRCFRQEHDYDFRYLAAVAACPYGHPTWCHYPYRCEDLGTGDLFAEEPVSVEELLGPDPVYGSNAE